MGIAKDLDNKSKEMVLGAMLEYIERIATIVSDFIACRFIRNYIPHQIQLEDNRVQLGEPVEEFYVKLFNKGKYEEPPVKNSEKRQFVKHQKGIPVALKYYIKDIKR